MELKPNSGQFSLIFSILLIVPYGIETFLQTGGNRQLKLLIVPYGIETWEAWQDVDTTDTFNRTLWN